MTAIVSEEADGALLIRAVATYDGVVGDPGRFGPAAVDVAAAARDGDDTEALVVALGAVAWFERSRQANRRAARLLDEAAQIARISGLSHRLGEVLVARAAVSLELGRVVAARRDLDRAAGLVTGPAAADLELKRAVLLCNVGRIADAAEVYRALLVDPHTPVGVRTRAAINLGLAESLRGRHREAMRYTDLAAELAPDVGPALVAFAAQNRGLVLAEGGRLLEGLGQFDRAVVLLAAAGLPLGEAYVELADTLAALWVLPEARDLAERAATELEDHDVPLMAAEARLKVAEIALLMGDHTAARYAAGAAADEFRRQRRSSWLARTTVVVAESRGMAGTASAGDLRQVCRAADTLARLDLLSAAVHADLVAGRLVRQFGLATTSRRRLVSAYRRSRRGPMLTRLQGRLAAALVADLDGDGPGVLRQCRAGLAELAAHRATLTSMELRALAAGHGVELGLLGLGRLLRTGSPARVLDWVERIRAIALLTTDPPADETLLEDRAELAVVRMELDAARDGAGVAPPALMARQAAIEHRIRRAAWHRAASDDRAATTVRTAQLAGLLDDRVLVSYGRHDDEMFAVRLDGHSRRLVLLGAWSEVRFEAEALQFALRRLTRPGSGAALRSARASAEHALARLDRLLVAPMRVDADAPMVVIPARETHRVPWSALHRGPVSVAPSASLWAATRRRPAGRTDRVVVVAGPGLRGAEHEAEAVAGCYRAPVLLTSPRSTAEAVLDAMARSDLVHLACHGHLRADNPTFSALDVTGGQLTVHELDLRGIGPSRVVLAACDSAADVAYAGDELLGFVSALLARGTVGLVASVVAVGDTEAVPLMTGLHERIAAGATLSDALHVARAAMDLDDPREFVNWCTFTAYGAG